jgi:hypothetical protein
MERGHFNAHHLKVLGEIHLLAGYTGPIEFCTRAAEAAPPQAVQEEAQAPDLFQATNSTTSLEEDLDEYLEEEQTGEDEEFEVLGAFFSVLDMSFDAQHRQEE